MSLYLLLPLLFFRFYFWDGPLRLIRYFGSVNGAFMQLFSLPLLILTFFKPWKNEYRKDFVPVAIGIGISIKTFVILADLILFIFLLLIELLSISLFFLWPFFTLGFLFWK